MCSKSQVTARTARETTHLNKYGSTAGPQRATQPIKRDMFAPRRNNSTHPPAPHLMQGGWQRISQARVQQRAGHRHNRVATERDALDAHPHAHVAATRAGHACEQLRLAELGRPVRPERAVRLRSDAHTRRSNRDGARRTEGQADGTRHPTCAVRTRPRARVRGPQRGEGARLTLPQTGSSSTPTHGAKPRLLKSYAAASWPPGGSATAGGQPRHVTERTRHCSRLPARVSSLGTGASRSNAAGVTSTIRSPPPGPPMRLRPTHST